MCRSSPPRGSHGRHTAHQRTVSVSRPCSLLLCSSAPNPLHAPQHECPAAVQRRCILPGGYLSSQGRLRTRRDVECSSDLICFARSHPGRDESRLNYDRPRGHVERVHFQEGGHATSVGCGLVSITRDFHPRARRLLDYAVFFVYRRYVDIAEKYENKYNNTKFCVLEVRSSCASWRVRAPVCNIHPSHHIADVQGTSRQPKRVSHCHDSRQVPAAAQELNGDSLSFVCWCVLF